MPTIKVQLPLVSSDPNALPLVYARGRENMTEQEIPTAAYVALKGKVKGYFKGEWLRGTWRIGAPVADEPW